MSSISSQATERRDPPWSRAAASMSGTQDGGGGGAGSWIYLSLDAAALSSEILWKGVEARVAKKQRSMAWAMCHREEDALVERHQQQAPPQHFSAAAASLKKNLMVVFLPSIP
jgi:hypothetical protein